MKRKIIVFLSVVLLNVLPYPVFASDVQGRTAFIVDTKGATSEVMDLKIEGYDNYIFAHIFDNYPSGNTIVVDTKPFYLGIPLTAIISIEIKGKSCSIKYYLEGQDRTIAGNFVNFGEFVGKTDFGDFKLGMDKLKKLTFKDIPSPALSESKSKESLPYDTILMLTNGKRVPVANFQRFNSYCSSAGYVMGCGDRYEYFTDFRFLRGESLQTVLFKEIKTIEFNNFKSSGPGNHLQGNVTVTLKNGKSATGKLTDGVNDADVDGYTGTYEYEKGDFFFYIDAGHVKSIVFGLEPK